jgi:hypothetical protein
MSDETPTHLKSEHRRGMAVKMIKRKLVEMGANEEDAATAAESVRGNLFVAEDPKTPILCRKLGGALAETYPASFTDPVGDLAAALFSSLRDDQKLVATQKREEQVAEIIEEKRQSGQYL